MLPSYTNMTKKTLISIESYGNITTSHKCMWSNGNIPFSGGTGRSPLLPPKAPPITKVSDREHHQYIYREREISQK